MDPFGKFAGKEFEGSSDGENGGYFMGMGEEKSSKMNILQDIAGREFVPERVFNTITVGSYLAKRLVAARATTFFTVPGDFILSLLDSLLANGELKMVGCCNELNAGYAGK